MFLPPLCWISASRYSYAYLLFHGCARVRTFPLVTTSNSMLSLISLSLFYFPLCSAICYYPGGLRRAPQDVPCNGGTDHTFCCGPGYTCLSNGLCMENNETHDARCTVRQQIRARQLHGSDMACSWLSIVSHPPDRCVEVKGTLLSEILQILTFT